MIIFLLLNICTVIWVMSQTVADSVRIHFQPRSGRIKPDYDNSFLCDFLERIHRNAAGGNVERLVVRAYTSPDGVSTDNIQLSANRCRSVADYIISQTGVDPVLIDMHPGGIAWDKLRDMIAADSCVPGRMKALDIIDHTPIWVRDVYGDITGGRKKGLMDLKEGQTYLWLRQHFFDRLHYATVVLYVKQSEVVPHAPLARVIQDGKVKTPAFIADSVIVNKLQLPCLSVIKSICPSAAESGRLSAGRLALKTNLLYAAVLLPSIELEWRLSDYWTMGVEGNMAWWKKRTDHKCYQLAIANTMVRRWMRGGSLRKGFYIGAFAGAGLYDFENGKKGYLGEGVMAGLSIGYLWPLGRHFAIEAEAGGGWMMTRYKEYIPYEGHHLYVRTQNMNFFGPLKLKLAIVWLLGHKVNRGEEKGDRV